jgi:hypothetical protein
MLLVYVDDVLCISHDLTATMKGIQGTFKLKGNKIEVPTYYLGAQISQKTTGGVSCWTMSSEQYIKAASLPSRCLTPMTSNYQPETDVSGELKLTGIRYFQELIAILRWVVKLGRVDIATKVSLLSSHLALP